MKTVAIIPSGGYGKRLGQSTAKPFVKINNVPLLAHTLKAVSDSKRVDSIILAVAGEYINKAKKLVLRFKFNKVSAIVPGGKERADSVHNALSQLPEDADVVLVHDGARPCVDRKIIDESVNAAIAFGASCVCVPMKPTVKLAMDGFIEKTLDRSVLYETQTPQAFKRDIILKAYKNAVNRGNATDDAGLVEKIGIKVKIVEGSYKNIKVTTPEDLVFASQLLSKKGCLR